MPVRTINWNSAGTFASTKSARIWVKPRWNAPWVEEPRAMLLDATWTTAPEFSRAVLQWRYGEVIPQGSNSIQIIPPVTTRGYYVCILIETDDTPLWWLGYADSPISREKLPTRPSEPPRGTQEIPCWGFDRMLSYAKIRTTVHQRQSPGGETDPDWERKDTGSVFNAGEKGNRSIDDVAVEKNGDILAPVFDNISHYWEAIDSRLHWSTFHIFKHVVSFHLPTAAGTPGTIPWNVQESDLDSETTKLPTWDRPVIESHGRSVHEVLSALLNPEKMLGWTIEPSISLVSGRPLISNVFISAFTRNASTIELPSIGTLSSNNNQIAYYDEFDQLSDTEVTSDDSESVDEVTVEGPREISVATFNVGRRGAEKVQFQRAWDLTDQDEYEQAFSNEAGWAAIDQYQKNYLNEFFRSKPKYAGVFKTFEIADPWNGKAADESTTDHFVFDGEYVPYRGNIRIMEQLPLYRGVDYVFVNNIDDVNEENAATKMPIMAFVEDPDNQGKYIPLQDAYTMSGGPNIRNPNMVPITVSVSPNNSAGPGIDLVVSGAPQGAIFRDDFTPNDGDILKANPDAFGRYDYKRMKITVAIEGDRRPQYTIGSTANLDFVRRKVITLEHESLQHVRITKDTVLELNFAEGLTYAKHGTLRDPLPILQALCTLAAENFTKPRKTVQSRTARFSGFVKPGAIMKVVNGESCNAVISRVRVSSSINNSDSPPPPMMEITAQTSVYDLASLVGRVPSPSTHHLVAIDEETLVDLI